jgi:hypothetical protein
MSLHWRWIARLVVAVAVPVAVTVVAAPGCGSGGGGGSCDTMECFRANECVEACGGPITYSGCCNCPQGTFDQIGCVADAGDGGDGDGAADDASAGD